MCVCACARVRACVCVCVCMCVGVTSWHASDAAGIVPVHMSSVTVSAASVHLH